MTASAWIVIAVLVGTVALLASGKFRLDGVGFLALLALMGSGVLGVPEALAGFSDPTVLMIGALFVVSAAFFETGLAERFGALIERIGAGSKTRLIVTTLVATATVSAFLSSTGTVALMVPIVAGLCRKAGLSPSKVMMPVAFATLVGGTLTLIATAPNMVASSALLHAGYAPFEFASFTGPGLVVTIVSTTFIVMFGPRLLPERRPAEVGRKAGGDEVWTRYGLSGGRLAELTIDSDSPLVGRSIAESRIRSEYLVALLALRERDGELEPVREASRVLLAGETIVVKGSAENIEAFRARAGVSLVRELSELPKCVAFVEVLVPPTSSLVGRSVAEARLRTRFGVTVLGVSRTMKPVSTSVAETVIHTGDLLLVTGRARPLLELKRDLVDAIIVGESDSVGQAAIRTEKAPLTLGILILMMAAMAASLAPPVVVVITAAIALLFSGCIEPKSAERSIQWESILLIATMFPMATALEKVGLTTIVSNSVVHATLGYSPRVMLAALFLVTVAIGLFLSNTATAVLIAPVALRIAAGASLSPRPFLMTVAFASSCAFLTPVSSPVNMLVVEAGGYRFGDFARLGAPLLLVVFGATLLVVPFFFPF